MINKEKDKNTSVNGVLYANADVESDGVAPSFAQTDLSGKLDVEPILN